jgi:hypothetical protein
VTLFNTPPFACDRCGAVERLDRVSGPPVLMDDQFGRRWVSGRYWALCEPCVISLRAWWGLKT